MANKWLQQLRLKLLARRKYYMLDVDRLLPGDVILSSQKAFFSWLIRMGTLSRFSHAAIYLGDGLYAEAVGLGVRVRAAATIIKTRMKVIRLKAGSTPDPFATALSASKAVNEYIHSPYWTKGALLTFYKAAVLKNRHRLFCSHLVAQVYKDAKLEIVPLRDPTHVTPASLARSKLLKEVSPTVVTRILHIPAFVVDPHFESLSDKETTIIQDMHADAADWFEEQRMDVPATWWDMLTFLSEDANPARRSALDLALINVMNRNGYFKLTNAIVKQVLKPMEKWLGEFDALVISEKALTLEYYLMEQGLVALEKQAEIAKDNSERYKEINAETPAQSFALLAINEGLRHELALRAIDLTKMMMNAIWKRFPAEEQEAAWAAYRKETGGSRA